MSKVIKFDRLSFAQQQALLGVARCGSARVRGVIRRNYKTAASLAHKGLIAFHDDRGLFELTEAGKKVLAARGYTERGQYRGPPASTSAPQY